MKKILCLVATVAGLFSGTLTAQTPAEPVLMTVGGEKVTKSEFLKAYQKNSMLSEATEADLRDYLRLYTDYRMKVQEAKAMQLDTAKSFQREWEAYKSQYAQQYLVDTEVSDQILEEAVERSRYHVRASHLLVGLPQNAAPKDTLAAYRKIMKIREEILGGLDFNEAATRYSDDPSAQDGVNPQNGRFKYGNHGELGYFSVLEMIYPFENVAYNTPVGQVSMPVRTQFGYHLIYVQDKIPAIAKMFVSQIFIKDTAALSRTADHSAAMARCVFFVMLLVLTVDPAVDRSPPTMYPYTQTSFSPAWPPASETVEASVVSAPLSGSSGFPFPPMTNPSLFQVFVVSMETLSELVPAAPPGAEMFTVRICRASRVRVRRVSSFPSLYRVTDTDPGLK